MASFAFCVAFVTIASAMSSIAVATEAGDWYLMTLCARSSCAGSEHTEEVQLEGTGEVLVDSSILENGNCCAVGS